MDEGRVFNEKEFNQFTVRKRLEIRVSSAKLD
jgi:hypothetical protein